MKLNMLHKAITTSLGGRPTADVCSLNPDGLGQTMVYPYYVVSAYRRDPVKVRFLDGRTRQDVKGFGMYLSDYDIWTSAL